MQSHNGTNFPNLTEYEKSIEAFAKEGVKVQMTEFDIDMLPRPLYFSGAEVSQDFAYKKRLNPYPNGLPRKMRQLFEQRYLDFFSIIHRQQDKIERVTFWGVTDRDSWLNDWPVKGRTNYPLLFDRAWKEKPVVQKIIQLFK